MRKEAHCMIGFNLIQMGERAVRRLAFVKREPPAITGVSNTVVWMCREPRRQRTSVTMATHCTVNAGHS